MFLIITDIGFPLVGLISLVAIRNVIYILHPPPRLAYGTWIRRAQPSIVKGMGEVVVWLIQLLPPGHLCPIFHRLYERTNPNAIDR